MNKQADIHARVDNILRETLAWEGTSIPISPAHILFQDLGADSLDMVEIACSLEDEFKIKINDDDINDDDLLPPKECTVADLYALVEAKVAK